MTPMKKCFGTFLLAAAILIPARPTSATIRRPLVGAGQYGWPVQGPVLRGFEPPPDPYSAGHRGIDIGAPFGSPLRAAGDGVVAFAGWVGGSLFISIDHPDGIRTTYSWLSSVSVRKRDAVTKGQLIGLTGHGHPEVPEPHLHFGARIGTTYIDPMLLLEPGDVSAFVHLAPLDGADPQVERQLEGYAREPALLRFTRGPP
jgi:murein DD-endopeptidase MepM/ murein hydrolase activator NlpD